MSPNLIGQTLLGQFRVDAFIASGGMGAVYRVWDLERNVPLAMKVLHADLAEDPSVYKRFEREARALRKLAHPNIVPFYGLYHTLDMTFLLERYIDGPTLKEVLRQRGGEALPIEEALVYLKAVTSALGYAHAQGVVHCDVKPGNVMVDRGGQVYLTDFGVARHAESTTTTIGYAGTAAYMAPEQCRGEAVSAATDVYGLGVMLYEMVTGRRPFRGDEAGTESGGTTAGERIRWAHLHLAPADPRDLRPELPEALSGVILKALAKAPGERWGSTREVFEAACRAVGVEIEAIAGRVDMGPVKPGEAGPEQELALPEQERGRKLPAWLGWGAGLAGLGVCAVIVGVVAVLLVARASRRNGALSMPEERQSAGLTTATQGGTLDVVVPSTTPRSSNAEATEPRSPTPGIPTATATPSAPQAGEVRTNAVDGAQMVFIPSGEFLMGASPDVGLSVCQQMGRTDCNRDWYQRESPAHTIRLSAYWIYRTEVTIAQYQLCVQAGDCNARDQNGRPSNHPVARVSWYDGRDYCQWAGLDLPTEAQWERAARGEDDWLWPWGNELPSSGMLNSREAGLGHTAAVGSYPTGASYYGLLDMAGNVWEWAYDFYDVGYYSTASASTADPCNTSSGVGRVIRGGDFNADINDARATSRFGTGAYGDYAHVGFRCASLYEP